MNPARYQWIRVAKHCFSESIGAMANIPKNTVIPPDNVSLVECPNCGFQRYVEIPHAIRISNARHFDLACKCGHSSSVIIEKRKFKRHHFDADGSILLQRKTGRKETIMITVKDLSRSGVKFITREPALIEADERIIISFTNNTDQNTIFMKEASIKKVQESFVSAEFISLCGDIAALKNQAR